jgi:DNA mismatch repair protein MutL
VLTVVIKEALGKFNIVPSLDFSGSERINIPVQSKNADIKIPAIEVDPSFNPFHEGKTVSSKINYRSSLHKENVAGWDKLFAGFEQERQKDLKQAYSEADQQDKTEPVEQDENLNNQIIFQFRKKYIITIVKSGLMIVDQHRAHLRVLFERFLNSLNRGSGNSQMLLYPVNIELNPSDALLLREIIEEVKAFGFEIDEKEEARFELRGIPADITGVNAEEVVGQMIGNFRNSYFEVNLEDREKLAYSLAKVSAINYGKTLGIEEMSHLLAGLFACSVPNYSPSGQTVIAIINSDELSERFKV